MPVGRILNVHFAETKKRFSMHLGMMKILHASCSYSFLIFKQQKLVRENFLSRGTSTSRYPNMSLKNVEEPVGNSTIETSTMQIVQHSHEKLVKIIFSCSFISVRVHSIILSFYECWLEVKATKDYFVSFLLFR